MRNFNLGLVLASAMSISACVQNDGAEPELNSQISELSAATRNSNVVAIRDVAAGAGLTNGAVLGGIATSETGLAHCWSDATWSCQGPNSPSCGGGPVVAGSGDGACSLKQGGLGMFQFDAGTHSQTLAAYGSDVLTLEGNIAQAVEFVAAKVKQDVPGIATREQALAWINDVPMVKGDARTEKWASILACRYNGCCNSSATCTSRRAAYRDNAIKIYNEFGAAFWNVNPTTTPDTCQVVPAQGRVIDQSDACAVAGGDAKFWRSETAGFAGNSRWTFTTDKPTAANFATWKVRVAQAGIYTIRVHLDGGVFGQSKKAAYQITHGGKTDSVIVDQSLHTDFFAIGDFDFSGTGVEQITVGDNTGESGATMTKLLFDAIEIVPTTGDQGVTTPDDGTSGTDTGSGAGGCSSGASNTGSGLAPLLVALGLVVIRRRKSLDSTH
jgi:MYXO-CTERM domain-containing protein